MRFALLFFLCASAHAEQWIRMEPMDRPITVAASGVVASADPLRFGPPPNRRWRTTITELAREGSAVEAGDVLASFDGSATDDRLQQKIGELNAKRSELESLLEQQAREIEEEKVKLADAESVAEKARRKAEISADVYASLEYKKLVEEKSIAEDLYIRQQERGKLLERIREAKHAELLAEVRRLELDVEGTRQTLESFTIVAPRAGLVIIGTNQTGEKFDVNDSVNPGMIIVELTDEKNLLIEAEVPEYAAANIEVGQSAQVVIDAVGGSELEGTVVSVASVVRRQSQFSQAMVRDVAVAISREDSKDLRPGLSAKLHIVTATREDALAVPDDSIEYRNGRPGVVVQGDGWRPVVLGYKSDGLWIVDQGLGTGEQVALR